MHTVADYQEADDEQRQVKIEVVKDVAREMSRVNSRNLGVLHSFGNNQLCALYMYYVYTHFHLHSSGVRGLQLALWGNLKSTLKFPYLLLI